MLLFVSIQRYIEACTLHLELTLIHIFFLSLEVSSALGGSRTPFIVPRQDHSNFITLELGQHHEKREIEMQTEKGRLRIYHFRVSVIRQSFCFPQKRQVRCLAPLALFLYNWFVRNVCCPYVNNAEDNFSDHRLQFPQVRYEMHRVPKLASYVNVYALSHWEVAEDGSDINDTSCACACSAWVIEA